MHLTLKIKDIPEDGLHMDVPYSAALLQEALLEPVGIGADVPASHVEAHFDISRTGDTISLRGRLDGDVKVACTRCLGEAHVKVDVPLHVIVGPESMGAEETVDDEIEYFTHDGELLRLEPVLRETLILTVPMSVPCREDCKGLCAVCGGDRNERDCGCAVASIDPRLAALKDIKL